MSSQRPMIGCRVDPDVKAELEMTARSLGVSVANLVSDAILRYLDRETKESPVARLDQIESAIAALDRQVRFLSTHVARQGFQQDC